MIGGSASGGASYCRWSRLTVRTGQRAYVSIMLGFNQEESLSIFKNGGGSAMGADLRRCLRSSRDDGGSGKVGGAEAEREADRGGAIAIRIRIGIMNGKGRGGSAALCGPSWIDGWGGGLDGRGCWGRGVWQI